ncbi:Zeaxanthin epoxidase, chloroplastic [Grifola frondosa]|uniref:Zeaxanthin epoxidase, chloroplastic n=1 Tax=Grifola frondosa TaxID=5627 RepID=A0A1C7LWE9_GRIFR|nr:Zeaxanthin epoxidase, chloroplastic [Grifola frondosa]
MSFSIDSPVLIVGAGIAGLMLAQCFRQRSIPYLIFERDESPMSREQGWGLTLARALDPLLASLPSDIRKDIFTCQVDQSKWDNDTGTFIFIDTTTLEPKYKVPPTKRLRVQRDKLRGLLMRDVDILWSKRFMDVSIVDDGVVATFEDGSKYKGCFLVGADGAQSAVRPLVADNPSLSPLPIRMLGTKATLTSDQAEPLQQIDPLLFQGGDPRTGTFIFISVFDKTLCQDSDEVTYTYQFCLSYPVLPSSTVEPHTSKDTTSTPSLLETLKSLAEPFHPALRRPFLSLPSDSKVVPITIADWDAVSWNGNGRVTLIGDAAHTMTMFRGDGANQGILDALELVQCLEQASVQGRLDKESICQALRSFEAQMCPRARAAVLASRQACLDAHDWNRLAADSPVLSNRVNG